ncbi:uncharacterized protein TNCT_607321 [Trichonephila clavata]|uniref:Uncharacterized protein n=1 Tax=Trichonephila clavata TaxID=2740835 RepID=A0A8X6HXT5_TRICU|nr:uncharacterized protein TNCT_607321 [Trichonephila clavata]
MQTLDDLSIISTGLFFIILGISLMAYGCQALVYLNYVGATMILFGCLAVAFGVYLCRTVHSTKEYFLKYPESTSLNLEWISLPIIEQPHSFKVVVV